MARDTRPRDVEMGGDLAGGKLPLSEQLDDGSPGRIGEESDDVHGAERTPAVT